MRTYYPTLFLIAFLVVACPCGGNAERDPVSVNPGTDPKKVSATPPSGSDQAKVKEEKALNDELEKVKAPTAGEDDRAASSFGDPTGGLDDLGDVGGDFEE